MQGVGARRLAANAAAVSAITRSSSSMVVKFIGDPLVHGRDDEFGTVLDARRPAFGHVLTLV